MEFSYQILLAPAKVRLFVEQGEGRLRTGEQRYLSYEVRSPLYVDDLRSEVRLAGKEKLSDLRGHVIVQPGPIPEGRTLRGVEKQHLGWLRYSEEADAEYRTYPASYAAQLWVSQQHFDELLHAARLGKMPSSFSIEVVGEGIKYGWEPDGSGKEWDNKNHPYLPVVSFAFMLPLAYDPEQMKPEETEDSKRKLDQLPATRGQLAMLIARLAGFAVPVWIAAAALVYIAYRFSR